MELQMDVQPTTSVTQFQEWSQQVAAFTILVPTLLTLQTIDMFIIVQMPQDAQQDGTVIQEMEFVTS